MEEIVKLIVGLAWPAATVFLVLWFCPEVRSLINRLNSLKVAGGEAVFGKSLAKAEVEAVQLPQDVLTKADEADGITIKLDMLRRIAEMSPRAAIMEAWTLVETAASLATTSANQRRIPSIHLLHQIATAARLSQEDANLLISLRNLRNQAAHLPDFALTSEEAERYLELAVTVAKLIESRISANAILE